MELVNIIAIQGTKDLQAVKRKYKSKKYLVKVKRSGREKNDKGRYMNVYTVSIFRK